MQDISNCPEELIKELGTTKDCVLARKYGFNNCAVSRLRRKLGILAYKSRKELICPICNKIFYKWISRRDREERSGKFYCSRECVDKSHITRQLVHCEYCNKEIYKVPYNINNFKHHFCSVGCRDSWNVGMNHSRWKGGGVYGTGWGKQKTICLERDNDCQNCGSVDKLTVHHIIPFKFSKDNSLENLITVCESCHLMVSKMYDTIETRPLYFNLINSIRIR